MQNWLDIEGRFRILSGPLQFMRLDVQWGGSTGEGWRIAGIGQTHATAQFEALSSIAGDALVKALDGFPEKPDWVSDPNASRRWFRALKEWSGNFQYLHTFYEIDEHDNRVGTVHTGGISSVVEVSANLCLTLHSSMPLQSTLNSIKKETHVTNIDIKNSQVGLLNAGKLQNIESISINVEHLLNEKNNNVAEAIKQITEVVTSSTEITEDDRELVIEQLEELSAQALLEPGLRSKKGVLKALTTGIAATLETVASGAQIWSTWGQPILDFFKL